MAKTPVVSCFCRRAAFCATLVLFSLGVRAALGQAPGVGPVEGPMLGPDGQQHAVAPEPGLIPPQEQVVDVRVEGARSVPMEKIRAQISTRPGRPYDPEQIEKDVRALNRTRLFVVVRPSTRQVPGGREVIFQVVERPVFQEVKIIGADSIATKKLKKEIDIKVGDAADPFAVEEGRRKLEEYYHKRGFSKIRVSILEGDKQGDRRAIFVINEGPKQKVLWIRFVGNTIVAGGRLQTQIKSRKPYFYLFGGEVNRKEIDEDVDRLTSYYRGLGFFKARIGRELEFTEGQGWLTLTFVIDEGPRYKVRNVTIAGNTKFTTEQLAARLKLTEGKYFNRNQMLADVNAIQDEYGGKGYVFADVKPENLFLDQPGELNLVYNITEGARYRVGNVSVQIKGENPHTKITTALNRMSLKTGDIVDTRELRNSERRLRASGLYLVDPSKGASPKIVYSPPELEGKDKDEDDEERGMAKRPVRRASYYRGEAPAQGQPAAWSDPRAALPQLPPGERYADLVYEYANAETYRQDVVSPMPAAQQSYAQPAGQFYGSRYDNSPAQRNAPISRSEMSTSYDYRGAPPPNGPIVPMERPAVVRGQYTSEGAWGLPNYRSQPAAATPGTLPQGYRGTPYTAPQAYPSGNTAAQSPQGYGSAVAGPGTPGYATTGPVSAQDFPAGGGAVAPNPAYGNQFPAQGGSAMGYVAPASPNPPRADRTFGDPNTYAIPNADGEPLRDLPLAIGVEETQTGRIMFSVGVNSEAGVMGSVILDERNFDWTRLPTSWDDIRNGTAWRGAGQRFRVEAVPGNQVQRYMITFQEPYLADTDVSLGLSAFYYDRIYTEWRERREGGRISLGYQLTPDLTATIAFRGMNVDVTNPEFPVPDLVRVLGDNAHYGFQFELTHDTRDNSFMATEGHLLQLSFEQVIGTYQYPRFDIDASQYFKLYERPDGSGRRVLSLSGRMGVSGDDTPIYERYFAGGFSTMRGFRFRSVSPRDPVYGMPIGGDFQLLTSIQYMFPLTQDDMLRGVVFVDGGTVEPKINDWTDNFRVAPGFGLRITVPMMGPAPIALDFAFPISREPGDRNEVFSFWVGFNR